MKKDLKKVYSAHGYTSVDVEFLRDLFESVLGATYPTSTLTRRFGYLLENGEDIDKFEKLLMNDLLELVQELDDLIVKNTPEDDPWP